MQGITYYYLRLIEEVTRFLANKTSLLVFDKVFCKAKYRRILKKKLNLKNPQGFNEKIQWLKLYDRDPLYTQLADKYAVRSYVKERVGEHHLNELYGVYEEIDEIDFENLPNRFALKATHGGGMNIICDDKAQLNIDSVKEKFSQWMKINFYERKGEWQYKNIKSKIICEKYLGGDDHQVAMDFKIYCFNGKPTFVLVVVDRFTNHTEAFFDTNWVLQPFYVDYPPTNKVLQKPDQFEVMLEIAENLSTGLPFCRVDLYNYEGKTIVGELTLHSNSGFEIFNPSETDQLFGKLLKLPVRRK